MTKYFRPKSVYRFFMSTIILSAKSKNTIRALPFCSMSRCARLSSSMMPMTLRSLMNGANFTANCDSAAAM